MTNEIDCKHHQSSRFSAAEALTSLSNSEKNTDKLISVSLVRSSKAFEESREDELHKENSKRPKKFPQKLLDILLDGDNENAISWLPDGRAFSICDRKKLSIIVLPKYFKKSKYASFTRRLNRWGFTSFTRGAGTCIYYHKMFQRDNPRLSLQMFCKSDSMKCKSNGGNIAQINGTFKSEDNHISNNNKTRNHSQVAINYNIPQAPAETFFNPMNVLDTNKLLAQQLQKQLLLMRRNLLYSQLLNQTVRRQRSDSFVQESSYAVEQPTLPR